MVYGCEHAADVSALQSPDVAVIHLPCIGMLPPSFIEFCLQCGANGVFLTGCRDGDCYHRLGNEWLVQRVARERPPYLHKTVPREQFKWYGAAATDARPLSQALDSFRASFLKGSPAVDTQTGNQFIAQQHDANN